jgi:hypothetical protein
MIRYYPGLVAHGPGAAGGITPVNASAAYILGATILGAAAANAIVFAHQPDYARVLSVKGNAGGIAGNVVITGRDAAGEALTDTIALSGTDTVNGVKAFEVVTNVNLPAKTNGSGDTVSVGVASIFGLHNKLASAGLLLRQEFDHSTDAGSLAVSATVLASNLYTPAGTPNGSKSLDLYYFVT